MKFGIFGVGRDGTTLLWRLLNSHSQLKIAYEPCDKHFEGKLEDFNAAKQPMQFSNQIIKLDKTKSDFEKYIFIKRNELDNVYSLIRRNKKPVNLTKFYMKRYEEIHKRIKEFMNKYPKICMQIEYENLCLHTEKVLKDICKFLDIPYEVNMLEKWREIEVPAWAKSAQYQTKNIRYVTGTWMRDREFMESIV